MLFEDETKVISQRRSQKVVRKIEHLDGFVALHADHDVPASRRYVNLSILVLPEGVIAQVVVR
jgi:hypothetical protein